MSENGRTQVSLLVFVREIILGDTGIGLVVDLADIFPIRRVLTLARQPHHVPHHGVIALLLLLDICDQTLWSLFRQVRGVGKEFRNPAVDLKPQE